MARYIVLRVEKNETADALLKKFENVPAIQTLGVFASGTSFCGGKSVCGEDRRLIRSKKYGTTHCSVCRKPVSSISQQPRNLMLAEDLHPRFVDLRLSVWEPYSPPEEKYGQDSIDRKTKQVELGKNRIKRYKAKKRREARKKDGR